MNLWIYSYVILGVGVYQCNTDTVVACIMHLSPQDSKHENWIQIPGDHWIQSGGLPTWVASLRVLIATYAAPDVGPAEASMSVMLLHSSELKLHRCSPLSTSRAYLRQE